MDSDGVLHQVEPEGVPTFEAPFKLPIEPEKVKNALEGAKKFLADITDQENIEKFTRFGVPLKLFDLLSTAGKIAGTIAPVFAVLAVAFDVLKLVGLFKDGGPSAFEEMVKQRFDELEENVKAIQQLIQIHHLNDSKEAVLGFLNDVNRYAKQLKTSDPSVAQLEADRNTLLEHHNRSADSVGKLLSATSWFAPFHRDEHTKVWSWMGALLHVMPAEPLRPMTADELWPPPVPTPVPVLMPPEGTLRFDHRLMVPLAGYAAESYLACIRVISPEYRTTGDFRDSLREFAGKLDDLAKNMRDHVLALTIYKSSDFGWPLYPHEVDDPFFDDPITIVPTCSRYPVGALDLRYHNDAFAAEFLNSLQASETWGPPHPSKHGSMDFRWIPPAKLERLTYPSGNMYRITNPDECAAAANEQSRKDCADLLMSSGYTNLLQLAALYRSEAGEPRESQTVAGAVHPLRIPGNRVETSVKSEKIFGTGVITSPATRVPQECSADVRIQTQPIKRARPVEYEIWLRTLGSMGWYGSSIDPVYFWREPTYDNYQKTDYEAEYINEQLPSADGGTVSRTRRSGFLKLRLLGGPGAAVGEVPLLKDAAGRPIKTGSPREPLHAEGVVTIDAHTFDWWVPVKPPFSITGDPNQTLAALRAVGWVGPGPLRPKAWSAATMHTLSDHGSNLLSFDAVSELGPDFMWQTGGQDFEGQHREPAETTVQIKYKLHWEDDDLQITLENNRLADRNYILYVVVQEKLLYSGLSLHTAMAVPINGQLTYVPQKFFDDERKAMEQAERTLTHFNEAYVHQAEPGPLDPVVGWVRPGDLASRAGIERLAALAEEHQPELLHQVMAAHTREELNVSTGGKPG
jgi:hypothetical protein